MWAGEACGTAFVLITVSYCAGDLEQIKTNILMAFISPAYL